LSRNFSEKRFTFFGLRSRFPAHDDAHDHGQDEDDQALRGWADRARLNSSESETAKPRSKPDGAFLLPTA
jgi:hypothetical protein